MPIPFGLTPKQFAARFRGLLEKHSQTLLAELRKIFAMPIGAGVKSAHVEIFLDEESETGPSVGIYFDGKDKKVDDTDLSIFPGRTLMFAEYLHNLPSFDLKYFSDDNFKALDIQADVVKAWFAEWWWKSGGWDYPLPVDVAVHDDYGDGQPIPLTSSS
jgi:hypothetical protein